MEGDHVRDYARPVYSDSRVSRSALLAHGFVLLFVVVELALRVGISIFNPAIDDPDLATRMLRLLSYFTIQSNIVVGIASAAIVFGLARDSTPWRALRLASLVGITVTGIVYLVVLAGDAELSGLSVVTNAMLHYITPPLVVAVWLLVGPWPRFAIGDLALALTWPGVWVIYTLVHGEISGWYPYPFVDVAADGYAQVAINLAAITVFMIALGASFVALDRWLRGRRSQESAGR